MAPICFALATTLTVLMMSYNGLNAQNITEGQRLFYTLMKDYDKMFRPVLNQSKPIIIDSMLELVSIQDFNEVEEKISFTAILYAIWKDERLLWDPKDYGGIDTLNIRVSEIWAPEMVQTNSVERIFRLTDDWHAVRVANSGSCLYYIGNVFTSSCDVDVTFYPWEKQKCELDFMPAYYEGSKMIFVPSRNEVLLNYYSKNGAWDLVRTAVKSKINSRVVSFEFEIERKPRFVIVNMILPLVLMSILNIMVFLIPTECGERISYSLTVLLSIAVFLTLVNDTLPRNSSPMSLFSYYLLSLLVISVAITLAVICSLHVYHKSDKHPGAVWRAIVRCLSCNCVPRAASGSSYTTNRSDDDSCEREKQATYSSSRDMNCMLYPMYTRRGVIMDRHIYISRALSPNRLDTTKLSRKETRDDETRSSVEEITWADVSIALDKVFFVLFVLVLLIDTLFFMMIIYHNVTL